jgi:YidC/Oxa1 family membrane protein insertase
MDKKTIIAIALCIGVWVLWQTLFYKEPPPPVAPDGGAIAQVDGGPVVPADGGVVAAADGGINPGQPGPTGPAEEKPPAERPAERLVTLKNDRMEVTFSTRSAVVNKLKLLEFKERVEGQSLAESTVEDLVSTHDETALPFRLNFREENTTFHWKRYTDWEVAEEAADHVVLRLAASADPGMPQVRKTFRIKPESYELELDVEIENHTDKSLQEQVLLEVFSGVSAPPAQGCSGCMGGAPVVPRLPTCMKGEAVHPIPGACSPAALKPGEAITLEPDVLWTGINEQYFLVAAVPVGVEQSVCRIEARHDQVFVASLMYPKADLPPGSTQRHSFHLYAGPKHLETMAQVKGGPGDGQRPAKLDASVNYGWLAFLCQPMLWLLRKFHGFVSNWGVAILFLTVLIKLLMFPLTQKQMKVMKKTGKDMARIKPQMEVLKLKYADDRSKLNEEMMKLYKANNINPFGALSGCLPLLLQMPVWIALYRMLYSSVELYQAPFIPGWIDDLSFRDPLYILPVVMGVSMFLQQKLTPPQPGTDPQQAKMMMYFMPAFFTFIMLMLPAGLALYIFVNSILSIAHQLIYNRLTAVPAAAAPDAKG